MEGQTNEECRLDIKGEIKIHSLHNPQPVRIESFQCFKNLFEACSISIYRFSLSGPPKNWNIFKRNGGAWVSPIRRIRGPRPREEALTRTTQLTAARRRRLGLSVDHGNERLGSVPEGGKGTAKREEPGGGGGGDGAEPGMGRGRGGAEPGPGRSQRRGGARDGAEPETGRSQRRGGRSQGWGGASRVSPRACLRAESAGGGGDGASQCHERRRGLVASSGRLGQKLPGARVGGGGALEMVNRSWLPWSPAHRQGKTEKGPAPAVLGSEGEGLAPELRSCSRGRNLKMRHKPAAAAVESGGPAWREL